jgi:hypothetical protein
MCINCSCPNNQIQEKARVRNVCFTYNNHTDDVIGFLIQETAKDERVSYLVWQQEICPKTKTPHIQGYVELNVSVAFSTVKDILTGFKKSKVHLEKRFGTPKQASDYCKKTETRIPKTEFFESGQISEQGKRTDLIDMANMVKDKGLNAAIELSPEKYILYNRGLEKLDVYYNRQQEKKIPLVKYWYGGTGLRKSKTAIASADKQDVWISHKSLEWFDDYTNQKVAVIDDFRKEFCPFHELLRILDRYPINVPIKCGFAFWNPEVIIITSNRSPQEIYKDLPNEDLDQLLRRIHEIRHYGTLHGKIGYKILKDEKPSSDNIIPIQFSSNEKFDDEISTSEKTLRSY